jgi:MIP family channel proteins
VSGAAARRAAAEGIGVFFLVLAGCGAIAVDRETGALGPAGVAAAFGLVVLVMVMATGHVSGAHLNPAVTLGFFSLGRIDARSAGSYVAAQFLGATAAAACLAALLPIEAAAARLGATVPSGSTLQSLALETLLTSMLMFVIVSVATDERAQGQLAGVAIGGAVALGSLWGGPVSGASMNPARSFGPALVSGVWTDHWIYWAGPIAGAVAGAWAYRRIQRAG